MGHQEEEGKSMGRRRRRLHQRDRLPVKKQLKQAVCYPGVGIKSLVCKGKKGIAFLGMRRRAHSSQDREKNKGRVKEIKELPGSTTNAYRIVNGKRQKHKRKQR